MTHLNTPLIVSQMLRIPVPAAAAAPAAFGTWEALMVSAVISLKSYMWASVAGPAAPPVTSPLFCW
jgi:hypothetical protein